MGKGKNKKSFTLVGLILMVLCFISAVFGVLFALGHVFTKIQHDKKWSDYDECGVF